MSVILALRGSLEDLENAPLYLTNESATSVQLLRLIMAVERLNPEYRSWNQPHVNGLPWDAMGGLLIGDNALNWVYEQMSPLYIDLGEYWYSWTGLPFVFAVWVARRSILVNSYRNIRELLDLFNLSLKVAESEIDSITRSLASRINLPLKLVQRYFDCLNYRFGKEEAEGMAHFFDLLRAKGMLDSEVALSFAKV